MQTCPALVISIHDVSPLTANRVKTMLKDLAAEGITKTSLLVIPNHHRKAPLEQAPEVSGWLREMAASGHEIVLHGYFHLRPARSSGWWTSFMTEHYTAGEGEFFDLSGSEAAAKLRQAREEFTRLGLSATGFIAPAWLLGAEATEAVRAAGFDYTTRLDRVEDFKTGRIEYSQSLVWSVRAGWRRALSLGWNALLARRLRSAPLLRVGLHPPDWDHTTIRRQALRLIRVALAGREAMTYDEWIQRTRSLS